MVGVVTILNIVVTRIQIMGPVIAVKNQMGEIARGNLSAEFALESNTSEIAMLGKCLGICCHLFRFLGYLLRREVNPGKGTVEGIQNLAHSCLNRCKLP